MRTLQDYRRDLKRMTHGFVHNLLSRDWFQLWIKFTVNPVGSNFFSRTGGKLSRGAALTLTLSSICTLHCSYCPLMDGRKEYPRWDECDIDEWKEFITKFPEWVSYVLISGGEPTLIRWMPEFVNWLLDSGRKVCIFTNLAVPERFATIQRSSRLQIQATYHHADGVSRFEKAYSIVTGLGHKIDATEVGNEEKVLDFTHYKPFITPEVAMQYARQFHCNSDAPKTRIVYCGAEFLYPEGTR